MPRWLVISMAIVLAQILLALAVGALLRRASARARGREETRAGLLPFSRAAAPRRRSGWRRVVGL